MGGPRISADTRTAVVAAVRRRDSSRAEIAREFAIHPRSVQRIADEAGIAEPWDTSGTRAATFAARDHMRARRAELSARFLDEASLILDKLHGPWLVYAFGGKDNDYNEHTLPEGPPAADIRNLMTSAAVAFDKHIAADKHDADGGADDAVSMLGRLAAGLDAAHRRLNGEPDEPIVDDAGES